MNSTTAIGISDTNHPIVQHTSFPPDHIDYSWMLLAVVALAMVAAGLREVFRNRTRTDVPETTPEWK